MAEFKKGDIRPVFQQVGYEVCSKTGSDDKEAEFIPVERISEAEILSLLLKQEKKE